MTLIFLIAVAVGLLRITGLKHIAFQAVAHLFLGSLLTTSYWKWKDKIGQFCFYTAIALSILEVACFFLVK